MKKFCPSQFRITPLKQTKGEVGLHMQLVWLNLYSERSM